MTPSSISLPNYDLTAQVKGVGRPLLLLHGAGGPGQFGNIIEGLSVTRRVIAPVHPGFDGTEPPSWLDSIEDVAFVYLDLLDKLGDEPIDVVGFSLGGWVAVELGLIAGRRMRSLTIVSAAGISASTAEPGDIFSWPPAERTSRLVFDQELARRLADVPVDDAEVRRRQQNWSMTKKLAEPVGWHSARLEKWLHRLMMPVHVIWGENDTLFPVAMGLAAVSAAETLNLKHFAQVYAKRNGGRIDDNPFLIPNFRDLRTTLISTAPSEAP